MVGGREVPRLCACILLPLSVAVKALQRGVMPCPGRADTGVVPLPLGIARARLTVLRGGPHLPQGFPMTSRTAGLCFLLGALTACGITAEQWKEIGKGSQPKAAAPVKAPSTAHGFLKSSIATGTTRQCTYDVVGNVHIVTMRSVDICPLGKEFPFP